MRRSDAGVVTIVTTLAISTFLLGIAALAVDLGQAYLRQNDLQALADRLALAGARGLPTITGPEGAIDQLTTSLAAVCASGEEEGELCSTDAAQWTDGNPGNGELTFYADTDSDGQVSRADAVSSLSTPGQALRVRLPPASVQFGLAGLLGFGQARIQASASARIGTPLGSGLLPFALTQEDVAAGRFCVRDPGSVNPPPDGPVRLKLNTAFPQGLPETGADASFGLRTTNRWRVLRNIKFHLKTADGSVTPLSVSRTRHRTYRLTLPPGSAGSTLEVWATGRFLRASSFTTNVLSLTYASTYSPGAPDLPCENSPGVAQLARKDTGDPTAALERNVRTGPEVNLLADRDQTKDCAGQIFARTSWCLNLAPPNDFPEALRKGLLESSGHRTGRLIGSTGNGVHHSNGYAIDATDLFESPHLLDPLSAGSSGLPLKTLLQQGKPATPDEQGWITSAAVRSHRLAVLPVIEDEPFGDGNGYRIASFRYVWIDSDSPDRGLLWENGRFTGLEGYVVDPGYLPAVVSGSAVVGPFLGSDMPREAVLTPDVAIG
ncbi:TadE/TadG family type IV pilus assembly protein [Kineosporia babensis]|uniref:Tad domain-containing protein n=1 Tax=Kineosporia babensis TaxID=499548 RepID=A0A9X1NCD3_9ACTN|nr:TadE/TadG family type IV pilus assembly protein [Kineosporia babensis]MCD5311528.1 Tad domain-containing protein [Kineosporia babensis]